MTQQPAGGHRHDEQPRKPWYREPWPWVAIGIPAIAVVGGLFTLYLAITHPDPLVVDDRSYQELHSELHADPRADSGPAGPQADSGDTSQDGDREL